LCLPLLAVAAAGAAATAGLGILQQRQQTAAANAQRKVAMAAAYQNYGLESAAIQAGTEESRFAVSSDLSKNEIALAQAQGAALTQFGAAGVAGGALDSVLGEYARRSSIAGGEAVQSLRFAGINQDLQNRRAFGQTVQETSYRYPKARMTGLDYLGHGVSGLQTGLGIYSAGGGTFGRATDVATAGGGVPARRTTTKIQPAFGGGEPLYG